MPTKVRITAIPLLATLSDHTVSPKDPIADDRKILISQRKSHASSPFLKVLCWLTDTKSFSQSLMTNTWVPWWWCAWYCSTSTAQGWNSRESCHQASRDIKANKDIANRAQSPISGASTPYKVASAENLNSMRSPPQESHIKPLDLSPTIHSNNQRTCPYSLAYQPTPHQWAAPHLHYPTPLFT